MFYASIGCGVTGGILVTYSITLQITDILMSFLQIVWDKNPPLF